MKEMCTAKYKKVKIELTNDALNWF